MYRVIAFIFLLSYCSMPTLLSQGKLVKASFYSEGIDTTIDLNVYLPAIHQSEAVDLPLYIFLHDCCESDHHSFLDTMVQVLDHNILAGAIAPMIVVWPNVPKGPFKNLHLYVDSPASGPFESVITKELISWIYDESEYSVSDASCHRAIGGFGMGADGAVRIATKHPDLFEAAVAHNGGGGLALRGYADLVPGVLFESPQAAPAYTFNPNNGSTTAQFYGASVAFSPNMENPPFYADFIVTAEGVIDTLLMEQKWVQQHNPSTLLQQEMDDPDFNGPQIYFDHGSEGNAIHFVMRPFGQRFAAELDSIGYPYTYHEIAGQYDINTASFTSGLHWLSEQFCERSTTSNRRTDFLATTKVFPNPTRGSVTIKVPRAFSNEVTLEVTNMLGQLVVQKTRNGVANQQFAEDLSKLMPGSYFLRLRTSEAITALVKVSIVK